MTDTIHHVDCEKTTFFEAALILRSFVYCAFTCEHEAQVQAQHEDLKNGLMNHKYPTRFTTLIVRKRLSLKLC